MSEKIVELLETVRGCTTRLYDYVWCGVHVAKKLVENNYIYKVNQVVSFNATSTILKWVNPTFRFISIDLVKARATSSVRETKCRGCFQPREAIYSARQRIFPVSQDIRPDRVDNVVGIGLLLELLNDRLCR